MLRRLIALLLLWPASAQADVYEPPSPLPPGQPGDVIRSEPTTAVDPQGELPAKAWRVLFRSTTATGEPTAVSGTVLVPTAPAQGERPVVAYSIGTRGIADRCAPSRNLPSGTEPEARTIRTLLGRGWAVTVSDLPGLGTPGDHAYIAGRGEGQSVLDAVRAARRLPDAGVPSKGPLVLLGYSQGGHSTSWAAQVQPAYAPDLPLTAIAAGATPSDLNRVFANVDGGPLAGLTLYGAIGLSAAYPELQLDRYLNDAGRDAIARGRDSCITDGSLAGFAFRRAREYLTEDVLARPDWQARLVENRVGALAPPAPALVFHARADNLIPFALGPELRAEWCRRGTNAQFLEVPGADHLSASGFGTPMAIDWLAARLATGPPARDADCRTDPALTDAPPAARACTSRRVLTLRLRSRFRARTRSATLRVGGRTVARFRGGAARLDLSGRPKGTVTVRVVMRGRDGRTRTEVRRYRLCG